MRKRVAWIPQRVVTILFVAMVAACSSGQPVEEATTEAVPEIETYVVDGIDVRTDGLVTSEVTYRVDTFDLELGPAEGREYKYRLEEGGTMVFSWQSSGPVRTEMHSQSDDQEQGTAEFFDVDLSGSAGHGTYTAPFPGIHGWYWLNLSEDEPVTVTVRSAGFYSSAIEFPTQETYEPAPVTALGDSD